MGGGGGKRIFPTDGNPSCSSTTVPVKSDKLCFFHTRLRSMRRSDSANYFAPPTEGIEFLLRAELNAEEFIHSALMSFLFPVMKSVWLTDVKKSGGKINK